MKPNQRTSSPAATPPPRVPRPRPAALRSGTSARSARPQPSASPSTPAPIALHSSGSDERGVYPCPFGFAVNVPLQRSDRLVPVVADSAAALAPLADALSLVRASGGFEAHRLRVPTAEIRFVFDHVPERAQATRRLRLLARDLLALGHDLHAEHDAALDFHPALELRCPEPHALSVHLYVEGTSSAHEALLSRFAQRLEPALRALCESRPRIETPFILRRRVQARCHVALDHLFASLPERAADVARETRAVQRALHWLGAARQEPVLAVAQNELVLNNVARVARALDDDGQRSTAEGHCHAARFGAAIPLASFAAAGPRLIGALELPIAIDARRRPSLDAALATGLMRGESIEDVGVLSTCLGLAAQLASVKAAISLALSGVAPVRASAPPPPAQPMRERRSVPPPLVAGAGELGARREPTRRSPGPQPEEVTVARDMRTATRVARAEADRRAQARVPRTLGQEEETVVCDRETAARLRRQQQDAARETRPASKPVPQRRSAGAPWSVLERAAPPVEAGTRTPPPMRRPFPMPAGHAAPPAVRAARAPQAPVPPRSVAPPTSGSGATPPAPVRRSREHSGVRPAVRVGQAPPSSRRGERR